MPISKYYSGHGEQVMESMTSRYGAKKGKRIFYATANADHKNPHARKKKRHHRKKYIGGGKPTDALLRSNNVVEMQTNTGKHRV